MTHKSRYGTMFPSNLIRPKMNRRVSGKVFAYENELAGGIGDARRRLNDGEFGHATGSWLVTCRLCMPVIAGMPGGA